MRLVPLVTDNLYHVYNRGVDKRSTFIANADFRRFIDRLDQAREADGERLVGIVAFVLMTNHFHLILQQCVDGGISRFMQKLGTAFTQFFNKKYGRSGSLFEGTFQAIHIGDTNYLLHLSRYIHGNPTEIVGESWDMLLNYPWSSLQHYLGKKTWSFVDCSAVMNCFDSSSDYENFMRQDYEG